MRRLQSTFVRYFGLGALLLILLAASTWLAGKLAESEQQRVHERLTFQALNLTHQLESALEEQVEDLELLAIRWTQHERMSREEWEVDVRFYLHSFAGYQSIQWLGPDLRMRWLLPLQGNEAAQNFQLKPSAPNYAIAMQAKDRGQQLLSDSVELVQGGRGFLLYTPLFIHDPKGESIFDGFMVGVFRVSRLMDQLLEQTDNSRFSVRLFENGKLIYSHEQPHSAEEFRLREPLQLLNNQNFELELCPSAEMIREHSTPLPKVVFGAATAISLLMVAAFGLALENARRARDVSTINERLNREAIQREEIERRLRDSGERLQLALDLTDSSHDALFTFDLKTRELLHMNRTTYSSLGYSAEEFRQLLRDNPESLIPGFFAWLDLVQQAREENRSMIFQREMLRSDRSTQAAEINTQLVRKGDREYVIAVARDNSERLQLEAQLQLLTLQDSLTGVYNRRYFDRQLHSEWRRLRRAGRPLAVLMLDIDLFKPFNDRFGHLAGDDVLRRVSAAVASCLQREGDVVCRYGGEEFVIILVDTDLEGADHVAGRIHQRIAELGIAHPDSQSGRLAVSIGLAIATPGEHTEPEVLVAQADRALYEAKRKGGDQTGVWAPDHHTA